MARFRRHAFGWRSQPAITRVRQAVAELRKASRGQPALAAEGAVTFLERLSPALEHVDSSSGAIGTAVNLAITELVEIVARAPADAAVRHAWLERLFEAHERDQIPCIERLADCWGELCASKEIASEWADRLIAITRLALSPEEHIGPTRSRLQRDLAAHGFGRFGPFRIEEQDISGRGTGLARLDRARAAARGWPGESAPRRRRVKSSVHPVDRLRARPGLHVRRSHAPATARGRPRTPSGGSVHTERLTVEDEASAVSARSVTRAGSSEKRSVVVLPFGPPVSALHFPGSPPKEGRAPRRLRRR
jgi:hypothetical protein